VRQQSIVVCVTAREREDLRIHVTQAEIDREKVLGFDYLWLQELWTANTITMPDATQTPAPPLDPIH